MASNSNQQESAKFSTPSGVDRVCLDEESFSRMLCLERKRTERSQRLFLLLLLDLTRFLPKGRNEKRFDQLLLALSCSIRDTDAIGWQAAQATLGIIFTEIPSDARKSIAPTMLSRVTGILYSVLSFEQFSEISISHHVFPEEWEHDVPQRPSHPTLYPDLSNRGKKRTLYSFSKRTIDVVGSALGLILGCPLFCLIALMIKRSSKGPVLFRQMRVGRYGKPFVFLKFRSMYVDNDPSVHREYVKALIRGRAERKSSSGGQAVYKLAGDPRVTRIGAFLRRTSLDELPQLYNVLVGEMSLVGPRPAIPYEVEAYDAWHRRRVLEAKPGITGLWQVKGRSRVTFDEMVRLDVRYAMTRSILLDLEILMQTPAAVLFGAGAC